MEEPGPPPEAPPPSEDDEGSSDITDEQKLVIILSLTKLAGLEGTSAGQPLNESRQFRSILQVLFSAVVVRV
jgi:hypothetical protein